MAFKSSRNIWSIDRTPTRAERTIDIAAAILLTIIFGIFTIVTQALVLDLTRRGMTPIGFGLASIATAVVACRTAFGKAEKPGSTAVKIVNYIFVFGGIVLAKAAMFSNDVTDQVSAISVGLICISLRLPNLVLQKSVGRESTTKD